MLCKVTEVGENWWMRNNWNKKIIDNIIIITVTFIAKEIIIYWYIYNAVPKCIDIRTIQWTSATYIFLRREYILINNNQQ